MSENSTPERRTFVQRLTRISSSNILRLVFLCVLAGFLLAALNVNPRDLWIDFFGTLAESWGRFIHFITESAGWAVEYFLLGAVLVIPIWIVFRLLRALGRES
jgi:Na+/H+-dicarboxylate symporter